MVRVAKTLVLMVCLPLVAAGQSSDYSKGHGYFYVAPGVRSGYDEPSRAILQAGGGGEGFFTRNIGLGADLAYVKPSGRDAFGMFSPNFVARFRAKDDKNKVEPFATAGYTISFRSGSAAVGGVNFGGGLNYWFSNHVGLRFEVRDTVWIESDPPHYVGFRIGVTFR